MASNKLKRMTAEAVEVTVHPLMEPGPIEKPRCWGECPLDILLMLFEWLEPEDLMNCIQVNTYWRDAVNYLGVHRGIWKQLAQAGIVNKGTDLRRRANPKLSWRDLYINYRRWHLVQRANLTWSYEFSAWDIRYLHVYKDILIMESDEDYFKKYYHIKDRLKDVSKKLIDAGEAEIDNIDQQIINEYLGGNRVEQNRDVAEQNGDVVEQNGDVAQQNGDIAEQNGHNAGQNDVVAEHNDVAQQDGDIAEQNDHIAEQNGDIAEQNDHIAEQNGDVAEHNGVVAEQNGDISKHNGDVAEQNGDIAEQNGGDAEQNDDVDGNGDVVEENDNVTEENDDVAEQNGSSQETKEFSYMSDKMIKKLVTEAPFTRLLVLDEECYYMLNQQNILRCVKWDETNQRWLSYVLARYFMCNKSISDINVYNDDVYMLLQTGLVFKLDRAGRNFIPDRRFNAYLTPAQFEVSRMIYGEIDSSIPRAGTLSIPDYGTGMKVMFQKVSVVVSVPWNKEFKINVDAKTGNIVIEYPGLTCATQHGDLLFLGFMDGKIEICIPNNLVQNGGKCEASRNVQDCPHFPTADDENPSVVAIEVYEDLNAQQIFVATHSAVYKLTVTYPQYIDDQIGLNKDFFTDD